MKVTNTIYQNMNIEELWRLCQLPPGIQFVKKKRTCRQKPQNPYQDFERYVMAVQNQQKIQL